MIKRTVEISRAPAHLSVKHRQLVIQAQGQHLRDAPTIPCEDIGLVIVDETATTWSHQALATLMRFGAAVVVCGANHLPAGLLLPFSTHTEVVARLRDQIAVKQPVKKRLWQQLVVAKIRAQAANLAEGSAGRRRLISLAGQVKSGDPSNVEAQAAKAYWKEWLNGNDAEGKRFRRDPDGDPPNNLLNYGYAILRATVARALVSAGLHPALGIHHCNRSNAFCLADDLLEPFRPMVDARARELYLHGKEELDREAKEALLKLPAETVKLGGQTGPLMVNLHRMTASLVDCFRGEAKRLEIPVSC